MERVVGSPSVNLPVVGNVRPSSNSAQMAAAAGSANDAMRRRPPVEMGKSEWKTAVDAACTDGNEPYALGTQPDGRQEFGLWAYTGTRGIPEGAVNHGVDSARHMGGGLCMYEHEGVFYRQDQFGEVQRRFTVSARGREEASQLLKDMASRDYDVPAAPSPTTPAQPSLPSQSTFRWFYDTLYKFHDDDSAIGVASRYALWVFTIVIFPIGVMLLGWNMVDCFWNGRDVAALTTSLPH